MTKCLLLVLALVLLSATCIQRAEATLFFMGGACRVGLGTAKKVVGSLISERGLQTPIEQVQNLCWLMQRYSLEGVVIADIIPMIYRLISLTARSTASFNLEASFDEFEDIIRGLAEISVQVKVNVD